MPRLSELLRRGKLRETSLELAQGVRSGVAESVLLPPTVSRIMSYLCQLGGGRGEEGN